MRLQSISSVALMAGLLVGCSGDAAVPEASGTPTPARGASAVATPSAAPARPSTATGSGVLPADEALVAALLIPEDLGAGFTGGAPNIEQRGKVGADEAVCDVPRTTEVLAAVSLNPLVAARTSEQVQQRLSVSSDAEADLVVIRRRAAERCQYDEVAGEISSSVKVEGPLDLADVAADTAGFARTYSGGYNWHRWDMYARDGRLLVHVQYTSTSPVDAERAKEILRKAVDKSSRLL